MAFVVVAHMGLYLLGFSLLHTGALGGVALLAAADGLTKAAIFLALGVLGRHRRPPAADPCGEGSRLGSRRRNRGRRRAGPRRPPPFASSVGKDLLVASAGTAGSARRGCLRRHRDRLERRLARRHGTRWRGETADQLSPAEAAAETPAGSGSLLLLAVPPAAPRRPRPRPGSPPRRSRRQHRRQLHGQERLRRRRARGTAALLPASTRRPRRYQPGSWTWPRPPPPRRRRPPVLRTMRESIATATGGLRRLHSGHVGDQITWAVVGFAVLAGLSGLALR